MNVNGVLGVDVLPDVRRASAPATSPRSSDKDLDARHAPGVQRLAHRGVVRRRTRAASSRWRSCPMWDVELAVAEIKRVAAKGCEGDHAARAAAHRRAARAITLGPLGPDLRGDERRGMVMCLHIGQGFAAHQLAPDGADRQPDDHGQPDLDARRAGPAVGPGVPQVSRTSRSRSPRAASGGSRSTSTACDRHFTNQVWLRQTTSAASCRARCSASTSSPATSPTRRRSGCATSIGIDIIAWECDYPHSDSIWPEAPEKVLGELERRRRAPTRRSTRSPGRTPAASSTGTRSSRGARASRHGRRAACAGRPTSTCRRRPARSTPSATRYARRVWPARQRGCTPAGLRQSLRPMQM